MVLHETRDWDNQILNIFFISRLSLSELFQLNEAGALQRVLWLVRHRILASFSLIPFSLEHVLNTLSLHKHGPPDTSISLYCDLVLQISITLYFPSHNQTLRSVILIERLQPYTQPINILDIIHRSFILHITFRRLDFVYVCRRNLFQRQGLVLLTGPN
jgi:hypothetical protein